MRANNKETNEQNFWISYADLMAGLLFVFILLIGAIVVKYLFMQEDFRALKTDLVEQKKQLDLSESELVKRKKEVAEVSDKLIAAKLENKELIFTKAQLQEALEKLKEQSDKTEASLDAARVLLQERAKELEDEKEKFKLSQVEVDGLKSILLEEKSKFEEKSSEFDELRARFLSLEDGVRLKDEEIAQLGKKLLDKTLAHQKLVEDLDLTKARIQNLTGIRIKVVEALKKKLGDKIEIDSKSGAIRLPSNILFDIGEYELKDEAKERLKNTLKPYFEIMLKDEEIRENIDKIVIEGHTDSTGSYMYNLHLSQQRALSVMEYIYSWDESENELLQKYLSANGRAYSDLILKNGVEDREASRRIEVKFNISNQKAIEEIETFLKGEY
ncbi:MAG: OmpA family protein [Sulfurospirillaceae bacterium]|nr:OmpA family protein [Sulfurospirillaceae bacterium]